MEVGVDGVCVEKKRGVWREGEEEGEQKVVESGCRRERSRKRGSAERIVSRRR